MKVLVINTGSSSLKYQLIDMDNEKVMAKGNCERIGIDGSKITHKPVGKESVEKVTPMKDHSDAIALVLSALTDAEHGVIGDMSEISAVGHRVVHGGEDFACSVIIDDKVKETLKKCCDLAPLHNPANLMGIAACEKAMPGVPMVAVFDTAFHQTMPPKAYIYGIPYHYYEDYKIRKYGFHGTSHYYVSHRVAELMDKPIEELKIITFHLGNGSSVCAVKNGKSIETSMGFTPLSGVLMGTRSGLLDPAIVTYIMEKENLSVKEMNEILNKESGVLGISGVSSDFRDIEKAAAEGNQRAQLALDMFEYGVRRYLGWYACEMEGVDAIAFAGGVGENNAALRESLLRNQEFMGIKVDPVKNAVRGVETEITGEGSRVRVFVIPTDEELTIARDTKRLLENR